MVLRGVPIERSGDCRMVKLMDTVLAQHRTDIVKAIEHGVNRERARLRSQAVALKAEAEQARLELAEEQSQYANLLQELEDLRFSANAELYRRVQVDERADQVEVEMKEMAGHLARVEENRASAKEQLRKEQESVSQLSTELTTLQKHRRNTERV